MSDDERPESGSTEIVPVEDRSLEATPTKNKGGHIGSAIKALISFFTIWHLDIDQDDMDAMERNFHLVPIVGLFFGLIIIVEMALYVECNNNISYGSSLLAAVIIIATVFIGSKFLHFDGLADFGDGMIVSGDKEKHVRALKDTLVGAGGVGVAFIVVLLAVAVYGSVGLITILMLAPMVEPLVKNAQVFAAAKGKAGPGMAGRQVELTNEFSMVYSVIVSIIVGCILCLISSVLGHYLFVYWDISELFISGFAALIVGIVVSAASGFVMARIANKNFGMVNGDILGATNEISRVAIMFFMILTFLVV